MKRRREDQTLTKDDLPGLLLYVSTKMKEKLPGKSLTREYGSTLYQRWSQDSNKKKRVKLQKQAQAKPKTNGNRLTLPPGWLDDTKKRHNKNSWDLMYYDNNGVQINSKVRLWQWFTEDDTWYQELIRKVGKGKRPGGSPEKVSKKSSVSSSSSSSSSTSTSTSRVKVNQDSSSNSSNNKDILSSVQKTWPDLQLFSHTITSQQLSKLPIGMKIHQRKIPSTTTFVAGIYVQEITKNSVLEQQVQVWQSQGQKLIVQKGDRLLRVGKYPMKPEYGTRRAGRLWTHETNKVCKNVNNTSLHVVFGREFPKPIQPPVSVPSSSSSSTSSSTSSSSSASSIAITTAPLPVDMKKIKLSDAVETFCSTVIDAKQVKEGKQVSSRILKVLASLSVEIVGDLCLMKSHNLLPRAKRAMPEIIGQEHTHLCWEFLEKLVILADTWFVDATDSNSKKESVPGPIVLRRESSVDHH